MTINPYRLKKNARLVVRKPGFGLRVDQVVRAVGQVDGKPVVVDRRGRPHLVPTDNVRPLYPSQRATWARALP